MMNKFNSIKDIDTRLDTGKMFLGALSILSSHDFINEDLEFGTCISKEDVISKIVSISNYVYYDSTNTKGSINSQIDTKLPEGKLLLTSIDILTSDECRNGNYGGHIDVDKILENIVEVTITNQRQMKIDLII